MQSEEIQQEALSRARGGQSTGNWAAIFQGFTAKGIPESEILPRENVLTYHAWRALGRQVRKGEHGVKVTTFVPMTKKDDKTGEKKPIGKRAWTAVVFHISQTDPIGGPKPQEYHPCWNCGSELGIMRHEGAATPVYCDKCQATRTVERLPSGQRIFRGKPADGQGDAFDMAYEDRCAEAAGINTLGPPE